MCRRLFIQTIAAIPIALQKAAWAESPTEALLSIDLGGRPFPAFQNGFLSAIDSDGLTVRVVDRTGNLVTSCQVAVPGASISRVYEAAISPQKTIIMATAATDSDGRYASLLIFADFEGKLIRMVRTNPFAAGKLVSLADGRLVCIGREHDEQFNDVESHSIMRVYSSGGVLISKGINVNLLRPNWKDSHPLNWMPTAGTDRIGLLDKDTLRYVEFDLNGRIIRPLASLGIDPPVRVSGIALLSDGSRLVSVAHGQATGTTYRYGFSFGVYKLQGPGDRIVKRAVTEIPLPRGAKGLQVLGVWEDNVVLLSIPADRLVFARQPLAS